MAKWADIAGGYRWLHDRAERRFTRGNGCITIPVIILSTVTGTANFALSSVISPDYIVVLSYAQLIIGSISIFVGILTTLGNFLRFAQNSEAHRVAGIAWGKLHRQITVEIAIHPDDREDSMEFLQFCRENMDSLVEQSPPIPDGVIRLFDREFSDISGLERPDICHGLEHTPIYDSTKPRLMKMVTDATIFLKQRKKLLRDEILPDLSERISSVVATEIQKKLAEIRKPEPLRDWRHFVRPRPVNERIYRQDDEDVPVSIKSETPRTRSQSLTEAEIKQNSSNSSTNGMVISMKIHKTPTPTATPAFITIPKSTPVAGE